MIQKGTILGERYELTDRLGEGGMGAVWVARNTAVGGAEVAVKVMHANLAADATAVERFRNEASIAARIGHPNIVRVFDFGLGDDGAPYMVMERLQGESLADRLEREGTLAPKEAARLLATVLEALAAAHALDVLHRDLKPENIFLAREGSAVVPKILDFGVSKILGDDAERTKMTRTGALIGTPAYMSPEQVMGATVDLRSDLWAMGVILYELVSGRLPFDGKNYNAVLVRIATGDTDPITMHVPSVDPGLAAILERAMARKASGRFPSAEAMREALTDWVEGRCSVAAVRAPRTPSGTDRSTPFVYEQSDTLPGATTFGGAPARRPWWIAAAAAATLALAVGVAARNPFTRPHEANAALTQRATLRIGALPPGARVTVDDQTVMLPAQITASDHRVRVSAPGYREWMQVVPRPTGDVNLAFDGERLPPEAPPAPAVAAVAQPGAAPVIAPAAVTHRRPARNASRGAHGRTGSINDHIGGEERY
ncbi:MAG: serine/threonine-protein kinase [Polyangiales bacterium]